MLIATKITARRVLRGQSPMILLGFTYSTRTGALIKTIPGWEYDPKVKQWYIPFTHASVRNLLERFPGVQVDRWIAQVAQDLSHMYTAVQLRRSENLPAIPVTKTQAWQHQQQAFWYSANMLGREVLPYRALSSGVLLAMDMGTG